MQEAVQYVAQAFFSVIRLQIADLLYIAILSLVIYKILWMLRKTSSGRVLRGILILLFAMAISSAIPLTATSFLLNKVVEYGILGLVILFQPEIRRFHRARNNTA